MTEHNGSANGTSNGQPLLEIKDLKKYFQIGRANLKAVDGISLRHRQGRNLRPRRRVGLRQIHGREGNLVRLYEPDQDLPAVDLPQPDSPTRPKVSPFRC